MLSVMPAIGGGVRLAQLGRFDALQPHRERRTTPYGPHPDRVAVGDVHHLRGPHARLRGRGQQDAGQQCNATQEAVQRQRGSGEVIE